MTYCASPAWTEPDTMCLGKKDDRYKPTERNRSVNPHHNLMIMLFCVCNPGQFNKSCVQISLLHRNPVWPIRRQNQAIEDTSMMNMPLTGRCTAQKSFLVGRAMQYSLAAGADWRSCIPTLPGQAGRSEPSSACCTSYSSSHIARRCDV